MSSETPSNPQRPNKRRLARLAIPLWRLGILAAACLCLHHAHQSRTNRSTGKLEAAWIETTRAWLPNASRFGEATDRDPLTPVLAADESVIGWATQTFPEARAVSGYAGASNLLLILDRHRKVLGTALISSEDTAGHLEKIRRSPDFFTQWNGRHASSLDRFDETTIVSGATLTSEAMARGIAARFGATDAADWFPAPLTLEQVRLIFPAASGFRPIAPGVFEVEGEIPKPVLLRSSAMGVAARGFQGPSDLIVGLRDGTITGVRLLGSRDNEPYTLDVSDEIEFNSPYPGRSHPQPADAPPLVVSGASYTARSIDQTVSEMLRRYHQRSDTPSTDWRGAVGILWLLVGLIIGLTKLRSNRKLRLSFAIVSMCLGGLWLGWMVAQDQWLTWAKRGSVSGASLAMLTLTGVALLVPPLFGKNIYCSHLCPHGAAQTLLGKLGKRRFSLPKRVHHIMKTVPWLALILLWLLALLGSGFSASHAEPFEIWSVGFHALLPVAIFAVGLIGAAFLPQAYCHYGCPTGALLKFLTHSPSRWSRRDTIALLLVTAAWGFLLILP
ncbi:4Fe-4S binding protein [Haloferula rosea]|uniref:4Fe-4S binding protein n=1 Tax=Haloferula rosea TaxID=490093 RepID=A0A934VGR1_9BACT|nr:4Fe-4S binding protein [Haloferula rosea]MBK1828302.1 4Fe-4S binding protein [Haloferula rosea]